MKETVPFIWNDLARQNLQVVNWFLIAIWVFMSSRPPVNEVDSPFPSPHPAINYVDKPPPFRGNRRITL